MTAEDYLNETYGVCEQCMEMKTYAKIIEEGQYIDTLPNNRALYQWTCTCGQICNSFIKLDKKTKT